MVKRLALVLILGIFLVSLVSAATTTYYNFTTPYVTWSSQGYGSGGAGGVARVCTAANSAFCVNAMSAGDTNEITNLDGNSNFYLCLYSSSAGGRFVMLANDSSLLSGCSAYATSVVGFPPGGVNYTEGPVWIFNSTTGNYTNNFSGDLSAHLSPFPPSLYFSYNVTTTPITQLTANFTNHTSTMERHLSTAGSTNRVNWSITADNDNISRVTFRVYGALLLDGDVFIAGSNGTSVAAANVSFSNESSPGGDTFTVTFVNITSNPLILKGTTQSFWFNVYSRTQVTGNGFNVTVNATSQRGYVNSTTLTYPFTFRFSGYAKNETGGFQNATNVSIYDFAEGQNGPPTETLIASTLTDESGSFTLSGMNAGSNKMYKIKLIYYNESNPTQALKVGSILPQFPGEMFYPRIFPEGEEPAFNYMKPPVLNGTTFYLGPAATINVSANNGTDVQRFGYMLMEQSTGFPIESNAMTNVTNIQIVVPTDRTYSLMLLRSNSQFAMGSFCDGNFMNDTACMTPPKSNSTLNPTSLGQNINVAIDMRISRVQMYGCINVLGNTTPILNVTAILPKMTPWSGFVPPSRPDTQDINLSSGLQLNFSDARCSGKMAWYNISLLNSNYLVEFHARNNTIGAGGEYMAAFQNVSFAGQSAGTNNYVNVTLVRLSGSYKEASAIETSQGTAANTTKFILRVQNSSGAAVTQDRPHIEITVRNSVFGELTYVMDELSSGVAYISLPLNSTAKAKVFANNAPPKEKTLNLTLGEANITLITMTSGDAGFRRVNSSGQLVEMNVTNSSYTMNMDFVRAGGTCDVVNPSSNCSLTSMNATSFNPFSAMVAGKVNMKMSLGNNVSITFYDFDMFSAKQPPMESVMDTQAASGGTTANQVWEFGSFVPADVYDYAIVSIPYSDTIINDSMPINMSIPSLYDENWNMIWNSSRGDTSANLSTSIDEYLGNVNNRSFNSTGYRNFLSSGGVLCNNTNSSITGNSPTVYCYVDTVNNLVYMRVPHFSGVSPAVSGTAPSSGGSSSSTTTTSTSGGGGGGLGTNLVWTNTYLYDDKEFSEKGALMKEISPKGRVRLKIGGEAHYVGVVSVYGGNVVIQVASSPQEATLTVNQEQRFDVTGDGVYDLLVVVDKVVSNKVTMTFRPISEAIPVQPAEEPEKTIGDQIGDAGQNIVESVEKAAEGQASTWVYVVLVAIIILIIAYLLFRISRKKRYMAYGY